MMAIVFLPIVVSYILIISEDGRTPTHLRDEKKK
jgi:hypothetical protein